MGADVNAVINDGKSAAYLAAMKVRTCVYAGARAGARGREGDTRVWALVTASGQLKARHVRLSAPASAARDTQSLPPDVCVCLHLVAGIPLMLCVRRFWAMWVWLWVWAWAWAWAWMVEQGHVECLRVLRRWRADMTRGDEVLGFRPVQVPPPPAPSAVCVLSCALAFLAQHPHPESVSSLPCCWLGFFPMISPGNHDFSENRTQSRKWIENP